MAFLDETGLAELWTLIQGEDKKRAQVEAGSYTGNGGTTPTTTAKTQTIPLSFTPKAVFVYPADGSLYSTGDYGYHPRYMALATQAQNATVGGLNCLVLTDSGFTVNMQTATVHGDDTAYTQIHHAATNFGSKVFNYIAIGWEG